MCSLFDYICSMIIIGKTNRLKVARAVEFGMYLTDGNEEILIPGKYIPEGTKVEDELDVFVYKDSEDRPIATTLEPYGKLDDFVCLEVKDVSGHGAFMAWGLEKDLFVPFKEQNKRMKVGEKHVVRICFDFRTERLIGVSKIHAFIENDTSELHEEQEVHLLISSQSEMGYSAIIDNRYAGLIYNNDVFEYLEIGDTRKGYIKLIREDGKIDLGIRPVGIDAIEEAKEIILNKLKKNENNSLPYHDKSDAKMIKMVFGLSKKVFKKAIGGLYKNDRITLLNDGIKLK